MSEQICDAIRQKKVIEFQYKDRIRIVEPYLIGVHKDTGNELLNAFQIDGDSESGNLPDWRLFKTDRINCLKVLDRPFDGKREEYNSQDSRMADIICSV